MPSAKPTFALTAMAYSKASLAALAYERVLATFDRGAGDSLYRFQLGGQHTVALLSWSATPTQLAAIAALPWGDGRPVMLPSDVQQHLALRSLRAAPTTPDRVRRVFRGPSGRLLVDRELPDDA